jgi:Holliday junction resolvase RusA-like endonuclease
VKGEPKIHDSGGMNHESPEEVSFTVLGVPGPQGSKRHVGGGRMVESSKKVAPWRDSVAWAGKEAMAGRSPLDGPLGCDIVFVFPRPKSRKKTARHDRKPDLSKLIRSTEDALTTGGVWADDARVVVVFAQKAYSDEAIAMGLPSGAFIRVWSVA